MPQKPHARSGPRYLPLKRAQRRPDCGNVTLFYIAMIGIVAAVAIGFLRTFRRIQAVARVAQNPKQLAHHISAALERSGIDPEKLRIQVLAMTSPPKFRWPRRAESRAS